MSKCEICGKPAKPKSAGQGGGFQRICSKHYNEYHAQRKTHGRSMGEFIDFMNIDISKRIGNTTKITEDNAGDQKTYWQARKEQASALRIEMDNEVRSSQLVDKTEAMKGCLELFTQLNDLFETGMSVLPDNCAHKSAKDVKAVLNEFYKSYRQNAMEYLDGIR